MLVADGEQVVRGQTLRALRYLLTDSNNIQMFLDANIDLLVAR